MTSGERSRNITLMFPMNVTGHFIPPLFIFPRKKMDRNKRLMMGAPIDSIAIPCSSGWMNGDIFLKCLEHFQKHVQASQNNPVLLILDLHATIKDLLIVKYARNHYIHILSCPLHITHKLDFKLHFSQRSTTN